MNKIVDWEQYYKEQNTWILNIAKDIKGDILSIGSGNDYDQRGDYYRNYFKAKDSYTTSNETNRYRPDMILDVRDMKSVANNSYDAIFCDSVIEHVDNIYLAISEKTRILKPGGILLMNFVLVAPPHCMPLDFWRFTIPAIEYLLINKYNIKEIKEIGSISLSTDYKGGCKNFPITYWVNAIKL